MSPQPPAVTLEDVTKRFGQNTVLHGLDLEVRAGEVFALLGANGAGKTTTLNILTTLVRPDSGEVRISGIDVLTEPHRARQRFTVTGQTAAVDTRLTTAENLDLIGRLSGLTGRGAKRRTGELAELLSLTDFLDARVAALSGGMRRRLDLALSLVVDVDVLFLDEPTTGLDTRSRRELWTEVESLAADGTTVMLTTQYLEEADALADRLGLLDAGHLVGLGTPAELKAAIGEDTVAILDEAGATVSETATDGTVSAIAEVLASATDVYPTSLVELRRPTLDDVFLAFTSDRTAS